MKKWEYRIEETESGLHKGQLNNLGGQGWRLVSEIILEDPRKGRTVRAVFERRRE